MSSNHNHGSKASNNAKAGDIDTSKAATYHLHAYTTPDDVAAAIAAAIAPLNTSIANMAGNLEDVEARVTALENPVVVVPPPTTVTVKSIADLYTALAANAPDITLAPGTYSGGIFFDSRFAARTAPGVIHCDGVTMTGGGLTFRGGAHDLDIEGGITFANWAPSQTGVLMFGGWASRTL